MENNKFSGRFSQFFELEWTILFLLLNHNLLDSVRLSSTTSYRFSKNKSILSDVRNIRTERWKPECRMKSFYISVINGRGTTTTKSVNAQLSRIDRHLRLNKEHFNKFSRRVDEGIVHIMCQQSCWKLNIIFWYDIDWIDRLFHTITHFCFSTLLCKNSFERPRIKIEWNIFFGTLIFLWIHEINKSWLGSLLNDPSFHSHLFKWNTCENDFNLVNKIQCYISLTWLSIAFKI